MNFLIIFYVFAKIYVYLRAFLSLRNLTPAKINVIKVHDPCAEGLGVAPLINYSHFVEILGVAPRIKLQQSYCCVWFN